ncbi:putative lipoprotein [Gottschalkia acidurici 9a]|uniref:Lipoprotein n=1 Tax=Gottschalkia acidurici (strain ATCC 7906 / DSM 604 / BCRC 14475 / CIP 104303 / KCTC 5404 / NCIMB 10678 / 9a) TaxID=1128398 RepID=K0B3Y7_GOTA9|nr:rhodanese-like domain-containing protein [Gottschalkia acidurici]AFS79635.1 putative lipoprotein [Gottschalkia acidurici 9a]
MKAKKILMTIAAVSVLTLSITGCSSDKNTKDTSGTPQTSQGSSESNGFQYYTAEQLKESIEKNEDLYLLDIQTKEDWDKHHIKGAVQTNAYPAKSDKDKAKLDIVIPSIEANDNPVVIICPGGKGGAEKTHAYLVEKGIDKDRLFILEKGQKGWKYDDLLEK